MRDGRSNCRTASIPVNNFSVCGEAKNQNVSMLKVERMVCLTIPCGVLRYLRSIMYAQRMSVCLRVPLVDKVLYIRGAQPIRSGHDQDSNVSALDELSNLAFCLNTSVPEVYIT